MPPTPAKFKTVWPTPCAWRRSRCTLHRSKAGLGDWFRRLKAKLGTKAAVTAAAHKLARILWAMVKHRRPYNPERLGNPGSAQSRLINRVTCPPQERGKPRDARGLLCRVALGVGWRTREQRLLDSQSQQLLCPERRSLSGPWTGQAIDTMTRNPLSKTSFSNRGGAACRREFLRVGTLGGLGLSLPQLLGANAKANATANAGSARADSCIVIFLNGGPSHLDMWDMKPAAPSGIRSPFDSIPTSTPGVHFCEHLPRLAKQMHHCSLVRSMHHSVNNSHAAAVYVALTGHDRGEKGGGARPGDHPNPGAVLAKLWPAEPASFPYVALPHKTKEGAGGPLQPGFLAGMIGAQHDPFWVLDDANEPGFRVRNLTLPEDVSVSRMTGRSELLGDLDRPFGSRQGGASLDYDVMSTNQRRAFDLLTTDAAQRAFQIDREPAKVRDDYGRNIYGQSVLLARRLIEAGTRVVTMSWAPDANATWDTHGDNFNKLKNTLLPQFDAAASSLIAELAQSGMLERTLVAVLGDFGRTPRINANAGRDHWNSCYSVLLAGGGLKGGYVHGASDSTGAVPAESPVSPGDIIATLYHLLGVDPGMSIHDVLDRPHPLVPEGRVITELIS